MQVFLVVEHQDGQLKANFFNALAAASQLTSEVIAIVIGEQIDAICERVAQQPPVTRVIALSGACYQHPLPERYAEALLAVVPAAPESYLLAAASSFSKALLPRVAARLGASMTSDVMNIIDSLTFKRPIYAGNAVVTLRVVTDRPKVLTIRSTAFTPLGVSQSTPALIEKLTVLSNNAQSEFVGAEGHGGERPELSAASIVVSGGRGLQTPETFARLVSIADRLGAAIGASRAAVDAGLAPNDYQVGQTGQVVAPKLYFAVGISGAIQHVAGMKDSKIIVAINKDPDAPIFQVADYGLVADLNDVLLEWEEVLTQLGY